MRTFSKVKAILFVSFVLIFVNYCGFCLGAENFDTTVPSVVYSCYSTDSVHSSLSFDHEIEQSKDSDGIIDTSKIGLPFIANEGQVEYSSVMFYVNTFGGTVYITDKGEIVYSLPKFEEKDRLRAKGEFFRQRAMEKQLQQENAEGWSLKEHLVGVSGISPQGEEAVQTKVNYFVGDDQNKWHSDIPAYNVIYLGEVYPNIDL